MKFLSFFQLCVFLFANRILNAENKDQCNRGVSILDCFAEGPNEMEYKKKPSKMKRIKFESLYSNQCEYAFLKFTWTLRNFERTITVKDNPLKNIFVVEPYTLENDLNILQIFVEDFDTNRNLLGTIDQVCFVGVEPEPPVPIVRGGAEKSVEAGTAFTMDATESINLDVPPNTPSKLSYKWECTVNNEKIDFCSGKIDEAPIIKVPAKFAIAGNTYIFNLNVKSQDSNWEQTSQTVRILKDAVQLETSCLKNCPPISLRTDSKIRTIIKAICLKSNCKSDFKWNVEGNFNEADTVQDGNIFIIKENVLQPGETYKIRVSLEGKEGSAVKELKPESPPKLESCAVNPAQGVALQTKFKISCTYKPKDGNYFFEIYSTENNNKAVLLTKKGHLNQIEFILSEKGSTFIKIVDGYNFYDKLTLDVQVSPMQEDIVSLIKDPSILLKTQKFPNADHTIQTINILSSHLEKLENESDIILFKNVAIDALYQLPLKTADQTQQVASVLEKLITEAKKYGPSPQLAGKSAQLFKKIVIQDLKIMKAERFPQAFTHNSLQTAKSSLSTESDLEANPELLTPEEVTITASTPFPIVPLPNIPEDYPNYIDDEEVINNKLNLVKASGDFAEISHLNGQNILLTLSEGENVTYDSNFFKCSISKISGGKLYETTLEASNVTVKASKDFKNNGQIFDIMFCTSEINIFWWNGEKISTPLVFMEIFDSKKNPQKRFKHPFQLQFQLENITKLLDIKEIKLPQRDFNVIRINTFKKSAFFIKFYNISETLKVVVKDFEKPLLSDFDRSKNIMEEDNILYHKFDYEVDSWTYLGISKSNSQESLIQMSVFTPYCALWDSQSNEWKFACTAGEHYNIETLICQCRHFSILGGRVKNNRIKLEETLELEFHMVLIKTYTVLIFVSTTVLIYCCAICFAPNYEAGKNVYLLSDSTSIDRYAYLIIIKTGSKRDSGTTANVCLKLIGQNYESKPHVLNFPDPKMKILQKNSEDWFFLNTEKYLGNLIMAHFWFDGVGRNPTWYCQYIFVYDFQQKKCWFCKVQQWLDLQQNSSIIANLHSAVDVQFSKHMKFFENATVIFSAVLSIYGVTFAFYGLPVLMLKDGFAVFDVVVLNIVLLGLGSCLLSFSMHFTLQIYRYKIKKCRNIFWYFLVINIVTNITILTIFGSWMPLSDSILWATSATIGIITYFLIEKLTTTFIFKKYFQKTYYNIEEKSSVLLNRVEVQRKYLFKNFGKLSIRPYVSHLYEKLGKLEMWEKKKHLVMRQEMLQLAEDLIMFTIYITLLYVVILANKSDLAIVSFQEMSDLLNGISTRTLENLEPDDYTNDRLAEVYNLNIKIKKINNLKLFYEYMEETFIEAIHPPRQWYGEFVFNIPGMMMDFNKKYIGRARIRQHKVKKKPCELPSQLNFIKTNYCTFEYSHSTGNFNDNPRYINKTNDRLNSVWKYSSTFQAATFVYVGQFAIYPGGGYIAPLGRTKENSFINFNYLKKTKWFDDSTRFLALEFLAYNPNSNLFNSVQVIFEKGATGYMFGILRIETVKLLFVDEDHRKMLLTIFGSFLIVVIIMLFKISRKIYKTRMSFFTDSWNIIDLLIIALSFSCFILHRLESEEIQEFLEKIEKSKKNDFINYFKILYTSNTLTIVAAFLVCIATIRLWKFLRFVTIFKITEKTLALSASALLHWFFYQLIYMSAFALMGFTLFGGVSKHFRNFPNALLYVTLWSFGLGDPDLTFLDYYGNLGYIVCSTFITFGIVYVTLYQTIITVYYQDAKIFCSTQGKNKFVLYIKNEYKYFKKTIKLKLKGGGNEERHNIFVTPKADECRFEGALTIKKNRLDIMKNIAQIVINNKTKHDKVDGLIYSLLKELNDDEENVEMFFKKFHKNKFVLVSDKRILKIKKLVELVLSGKSKNKKFEEKDPRIETLERIQKKLDNIVDVLKNIEFV